MINAYIFFFKHKFYINIDISFYICKIFESINKKS